MKINNKDKAKKLLDFMNNPSTDIDNERYEKDYQKLLSLLDVVSEEEFLNRFSLKKSTIIYLETEKVFSSDQWVGIWKLYADYKDKSDMKDVFNKIKDLALIIRIEQAKIDLL